MFQFTLPRGERPRNDYEKQDQRYVSIHAPARGATVALGLTPIEYYVSIHAPARGATSCSVSDKSSALCFNSRSREGSD